MKEILSNAVSWGIIILQVALGCVCLGVGWNIATGYPEYASQFLGIVMLAPPMALASYVQMRISNDCGSRGSHKLRVYSIAIGLVPAAILCAVAVFSGFHQIYFMWFVSDVVAN